MSIARTLWQENADLAEAALRHPFVQGIADGTLDRDRYVGYLAQDAIYLEAFARAYALALASAPDRAGVEAFAALIGGVREELRLHDGVAARWGIGPDEVAARHSSYTYRVAFCGFAPGFGYLTGLPAELHVPRRDTPRTRVPAGALALAGPYSAVYPRATPGGWQLIGRTAPGQPPMWDVNRDQPALLLPGMWVRFRAVTA